MQIRKFKKKSDFFGHGSISKFKDIKFKLASGKKSKFEDFYPAADITGGIEYAVVCTQDCDIEQKKVSHFNIALLEPIQRPKKENPIKFLDLPFEKLVESFESYNFYSDSSFNPLKTRVEELLDNTNAQFLFVELKGEYYFINLTKMFPLKFEHFEQIRLNAEFQLDGSFKHLLGWKIANLYGRVGVPVYPEGTKKDHLKNILSVVGQSVRSKWPANSYKITDEQMKKLKPELSNYNAKKQQGKDVSKLAESIYKKLEEEKIVEKQE